MYAKQKRLNRLFNKSGNITVLPLDHGFTLGPISGIDNFDECLKSLTPLVDTVIMHKGMITSNYQILSKKELGLIMHLSGNSKLSPVANKKIITATVEEALELGCDGVSIHTNLGSASDTDMLKDFAEISAICNRYGMPLLAMMYARGEHINDEYSVESVKLVARVAQELGADMVKVNYTGDQNGFNEVVKGCQIPVIVAGGNPIGCDELFTNISDAMSAGAKGVAVGRNVFQANNPEEIITTINSIIHKSPDQTVISTNQRIAI